MVKVAGPGECIDRSIAEAKAAILARGGGIFRKSGVAAIFALLLRAHEAKQRYGEPETNAGGHGESVHKASEA